MRMQDSIEVHLLGVFVELVWYLRRASQRFHRLQRSLSLRGGRGTLRHLHARRIELSALERQVAPVVQEPWADALQRPSMLVIETACPDPTRDSGSYRLCAMLRLLCDAGWHVDLFVDEGGVSVDQAISLACYGARVHHGGVLPWLRRYGKELDAVMLCRLPMAAQYFWLVRKRAPSARCIFDTVDLHHLRERRVATLTGNWRLARQAKASRRRELALISQCDLTFVVSETERGLLSRELPHARVELLSNIHESHEGGAPFAARSDLLFIGGAGHPPNVDALIWFVEAILPILRAAKHDLCLDAVGDMTAELGARLARPGVRLHGRVPDLDMLMNRCRVSVAPLRFGAGVKGKVNLAMSYGVPVVLTPTAAEGMHIIDGEQGLIAADAEAFAAAILRLYDDPALWTRLAAGGRRLIREYFSRDSAKAILRQVLPGKSGGAGM